MYLDCNREIFFQSSIFFYIYLYRLYLFCNRYHRDPESFVGIRNLVNASSGDNPALQTTSAPKRQLQGAAERFVFGFCDISLNIAYIIIYYHILSYIIIYYHILSYIIIYYHMLYCMIFNMRFDRLT